MQYPLVPVKSHSLVIFDGDDAACSELSSKLSKLNKEHIQLVGRIGDVTEIIEKTVEILGKHNGELSEEVDTYATFLQAQIDIEEDDKAHDPDFKSFFDSLDLDSDEDDDAFDEQMEKDDERKIVTNRDLRREAKALFKKIANLSHPDKVGHSRFVELYKEAYEASELGNLVRLHEILKSLKDSTSLIKSVRKRVRRELELQIAELENKIKLLSNELTELVDSEEYDYSKLRIEIGIDVMVSTHRSDLKAMRNLLRGKLSSRGFDPDNLPL